MILAALDTAAVTVILIGALVNVSIGSIAAWIGWQNRRLTERNDADHAELRLDLKHLDGEVDELRETRPRRDEILSHVVSLTQEMHDVAREVSRLTGVVSATADNRREDGA
ncbi:MAG TPA: hypothetical protein VMW52_00795 [Phycisphaerae bacterium]|nr:hypothetical protein [Phycisphaerae bacterium]